MKHLPALVSTAALLIAGSASAADPRVVTLDEEQLNAQAAHALPIDRRVLEVLDIILSAPRLTLQPERNRIATELEMRGAERLFGSPLSGRLAFDSLLRFEPSDQSLRLTEVQVHDLRFDGDGADWPRAGVQKLGAALAELMLENAVIYRLSEQRRAQLGPSGLQAGFVTVTSRVVEISLLPAVP